MNIQRSQILNEKRLLTEQSEKHNSSKSDFSN